MPGTISKSARRPRARASASSPPRPNTNGSPPLRRTTRLPSSAELDEQRRDLLLRHGAARVACRRRSARRRPVRGPAHRRRRAHRGRSRRPRRSAAPPRTVSRSGSPGPGPDEPHRHRRGHSASVSVAARCPRRRPVGAGSNACSSARSCDAHQSPNPTVPSRNASIRSLSDRFRAVSVELSVRSAEKRSRRGRRSSGTSVERDVGTQQLGQAIALLVAADVDVVVLLGPSDDAEFGAVGAGAAVRAAGHVQTQRQAGVAGVGEELLEIVDHVGQDPFGLAERLAARRQRHAGDRQAADRRLVAGQRDPVARGASTRPRRDR